MSKILIADDSEALLEALKYILERNGYEVRTLHTTDTIYKEMYDFQPNLLILDIFLYGDDGRELCKELRKTFKDTDLRILVFSSFPKYLEDYQSYFADDFIEKPFELKDLIGKIKSLLNRQLVPDTVL